MVAELVTEKTREVFATGRLVLTFQPGGKCVIGIEPDGGGTGLELTFRCSEALKLLAGLRVHYQQVEADDLRDLPDAVGDFSDDPLFLGGYDDGANG